MKNSSPKAIFEIEQKLINTFRKAAEKAVEAAANPNQKLRDADEIFQDFENACRASGKTSIDAAYAEVKELLTLEMQSGGTTKALAEEWFEPRWEKVLDLGERVRTAIPKIQTAAKHTWLKVLGAMAIGPALIAAGIWVQSIPSNSEIRLQNQVREANAIFDQARSFQASEEQFDAIRNMTAIQTPLAPEPMPIAVAALAPISVQVTVTTATGTQTFTTNVGRVWESVPQARPVIEQNTASHSNREFHKDFTVKSELGSAHFQY